MTGPRVLVVAKAPVPGRAKTRLGAVVGDEAAAHLAHAALLDTLDVCVTAFPAGRRHLALDGDPGEAARPDELADALATWQVRPQVGGDLGARLAAAHADLDGPDAVVQLGMDTPQVTSDDLAAVLSGLAGHDALLGPAEDGGWWVLAMQRSAEAAVLRDVEMSTAHAERDTAEALRGRGLAVATGAMLRDVDTVDDAVAVAALAPWTRFARTWEQVAGSTSS